MSAPANASRRRWWRRRAAAARRSLPKGLRGWPARVGAGAGIAAAVVLLTATSASAAGPGFYAVTGTLHHAFPVLSTGALTQGVVDDSVFPLSTTGSGVNRLPFPLRAFNQTYQNAAVSSNGFLVLGTTAGQVPSAPNNACLPTGDFGHPLVAAYWRDLTMNAPEARNPFPDGIFVRTAGTAPHRTFTVSWQGEEFSTDRPVLAQVVFGEGSQNFAFLYGTSALPAATVGVQSKQQLTWTEWSCDLVHDPGVTAGLRVSAVHRNGVQPA